MPFHLPIVEEAGEKTLPRVGEPGGNTGPLESLRRLHLDEVARDCIWETGWQFGDAAFRICIGTEQEGLVGYRVACRWRMSHSLSHV